MKQKWIRFQHKQEEQKAILERTLSKLHVHNYVSKRVGAMTTSFDKKAAFDSLAFADHKIKTFDSRNNANIKTFDSKDH